MADPLVAGAFTGVGNSSPAIPYAYRNFNISIWGTFVGAVRLARSFDGGVTYLPLTAGGSALMTFTGPVSEQWSEPEAEVFYRLECTAYTSGTINYRISQ